MKRVFCLLSIMVSIVMPSFSQVQFGYLSYSTVKKQMPEYTQAQNNMAALRTKYEQEAQRGEDEFQKKFVEFLQGQKEFPTTILQKRQAELQNLMDNGLSFRNQAQGLLAEAEKERESGVAVQEAEKAANKGEAEIIIAKHRNGPVGTVKLLFQGSITKFKNPIKTDVF